MRKLVLGPAREFCLHTAKPVALPALFTALVFQLEQVWPAQAGHTVEEMR